MLEERRRLVAEVAAAWRTAGLDALVCPAYPMPAPPLSYAPRLAGKHVHTDMCSTSHTHTHTHTDTPCPHTGTQATTGVYSLMNFPVGVVPVTHETQDDQEKLEDYPAHHAALRNVKEVRVAMWP